LLPSQKAAVHGDVANKNILQTIDDEFHAKLPLHYKTFKSLAFPQVMTPVTHRCYKRQDPPVSYVLRPLCNRRE